MKSPAELREVITRRVRARWREAITGDLDPYAFPWRLPVGKPSPEALDRRLNDIRRWSRDIDAFARQHGFLVETASRRSSSGLRQVVPAAVSAPSFEVAVQAAGLRNEFVRDRGRVEQLSLLMACGVTNAQLAGVIHRIRTWGQKDVAVLASALVWFNEHSAAGLTAREVPVPLMNSKWLTASRQSEVALLLGRTGLGLTDGRPARRHFRYIDPAHLDAGGRQFDVAAAGDVNRPEYLPDLVILCENVDSAQQLPRRAGSIVFESDGDAGAALIGEIDWVKRCPRVLYWGDMDVDGLSIVHTYRTRGLDVETVLMDDQAYERFAHVGISVDRHGKPLPVPPKPELKTLTGGEARLLDLLCDPAATGPRRIEQERLPRDVVVAEIDRLVQHAPA